MKTIDEFAKYAKTQNVPLLLDTTDATAFPFMAGYIADFATFDRYFKRKVGCFIPYVVDDNEDDDLTDAEMLADFKLDVKALFAKNSETYTRLAAVYDFEYNPIENYSMVENMTDTNTHGQVQSVNDIGLQKSTQHYGEASVENDMAQVQTTNDFGAVSNTDTYGAHTDKDIMAQHHEVKEDSIQGDNASAYAPTTKSDLTADAYTDEHEFAQKIDSHSENARTDTSTVGAHKDTVKSLTHEDYVQNDAHQNVSTVNEHTDELVHGGSRSGNIGVTTSQQMIESEIALWKNFNLFDVIISDITKELLYYHSTGPDPIYDI